MKLEKQIKFHNQISDSNCEDSVSDLLPVSQDVVRVHKRGSSVNTEVSIRSFPGPPKSSRSQEIKEELIRTHSRQSNDRPYSKQHQQLTSEHERLLIEKQYLDVVLKQQKCLNHLKKKIQKLEHRESRENSYRCMQSKIGEGIITSTRSPSIDCITPKVLNEEADDQSSISRSISVMVIPESGSVGGGSSGSGRSREPISNTTERGRKEISPRSDSMILREDDLLILSGEIAYFCVMTIYGH